MLCHATHLKAAGKPQVVRMNAVCPSQGLIPKAQRCLNGLGNDYSPSFFPVMNASTMKRRWILPVAVLGSSSAKNISAGTCIIEVHVS